MMAKQDYYDALGVARDAKDSRIKSAYRKLALQHHPDRNSGDKEAEKRFQEISEAYEVLKDSKKRAAYDRFGHQAFSNQGAAGGQGSPFPQRGGFSNSGSFADIFDEMFGSSVQGSSRKRRGNDVRYDLRISLLDAFEGKVTSVQVPSARKCEVCSGTGGRGGKPARMCPTCRGSGRLRSRQGVFSIEQTCPQCRGEGRFLADPCLVCGGLGKVERHKMLEVAIPRGVEDGTQIRLAGKGGIGEIPGDLYIFLSIPTDPVFARRKADLLMNLPLTLVQAALGANVEFSGIDRARLNLRIPPGAQVGQILRLRGCGMPRLHASGRGDLLVSLLVEVPQRLDAKQKLLLRQFAQTQGESNSPKAYAFQRESRRTR